MAGECSSENAPFALKVGFVAVYVKLQPSWEKGKQNPLHPCVIVVQLSKCGHWRTPLMPSCAFAGPAALSDMAIACSTSYKILLHNNSQFHCRLCKHSMLLPPSYRKCASLRRIHGSHNCLSKVSKNRCGEGHFIGV